MKNKAYKVILSDLDGVLRTYPKSHSESIEVEFNLPPGSLLPLAFQKKFLQEVVTGRITDEAWRFQIVEEVGKIIPIGLAKKAIDQWSQFPGKLEIAVLDLYRAKKSQCKLALLTNGTTKLNSDLKILEIHDFFDVIFNTSEIGFAKPDQRAFEHVISKLQCEPQEILFIDDRLENIAVARSLNFATHHFKTHQELEPALRW